MTLEPPVHAKPRYFAPGRLKQVKAEFEVMIEQGVMHREAREHHPHISYLRRTEEFDRVATTGH